MSGLQKSTQMPSVELAPLRKEGRFWKDYAIIGNSVA